MMATQMFEVIPWKMTLDGHWLECEADSSHSPDWTAAPHTAAVTAIDTFEQADEVHVVVRIDLSPQEAMTVSFAPDTFPFLTHVLHGSRLRLWVNDLGGIEITDMDKHLRIVREYLRASAGLAMGTHPADALLRHLEQLPGAVTSWQVEEE